MLFVTCTDFCDFYKMDLDMADKYCEELLAISSEEGKLEYQPTYAKVIDQSKLLKNERRFNR